MVVSAQTSKTKSLCCISENEVEVYTNRKKYLQLSQEQRRNFIYHAEPGSMCIHCFYLTHGIKRSTWYRIKGLKQCGQLTFEHRNNLLKKPQDDTLLAAEWLRAYACKAGDFMPDCDEVHLPDYCWTSVYTRYKLELPQKCIAVSSFNALHRGCTELRKIKIRKCKRFSKCEKCAELDQFIRTNSGIRSQYWKQKKIEHINWQMNERKKLAKHVEKATNPETKHKCMVIEMDNMDNQKTAVGQMKRDPKSLAALDKLKTHITGVHVPGDEEPFRCYTWHDRFPAGSDVVITVLLRVLCEVAAKGPLPPTLYLHLDNCWRENKNRFVLGIGHLLVAAGVFKKVKPCFLPVGHTHNIVDQMFSRFSVAIKLNDIFSLEDLVKVCRGAYQARACHCGKPSRWKVNKKNMEDESGCKCKYVQINFQHLDDMACWGPFLLLHLAPHIHGTSKPRCFRIERGQDGIVRHHYRAQLQVDGGDVDMTEATSPNAKLCNATHEWMPHIREGLELFPDGPPSVNGLSLVTVPFKQLDIPALRKTRKALGAYMDADQKLWWDRRLDAFDDEDTRCALYFPTHSCVF